MAQGLLEFLIAGLKIENCDTLKVEWRSNSNLNLHNKLKNMRMKIKEWNMHVNGNIDQNIVALEKDKFKVDELGVADYEK